MRTAATPFASLDLYWSCTFAQSEKRVVRPIPSTTSPPKPKLFRRDLERKPTKKCSIWHRDFLLAIIEAYVEA
jgi:hypothetical protein